MKGSILHLIISLSLFIYYNDELNHLIIKGDGYDVIGIIAKDETIYTQGLFFGREGDGNDYLYESGGLYDQSNLIKYLFPSMIKVIEKELDSKYFAEGIAVCYSPQDKQDVLYQLTYKEIDILKYAYPSLDYIGTIPIDESMKEGWGLAHGFTSKELLATDGSDNIFILDCENNLKVKHKITIKYNNKPLNRLNELTIVNTTIYANRYFDHSIYIINPLSGQALKSYDMTPLVRYEIEHHSLNNNRLNQGDVLNGITYNPSRDSFLLTGKRWANYYIIKFQG